MNKKIFAKPVLYLTIVLIRRSLALWPQAKNELKKRASPLSETRTARAQTLVKTVGFAEFCPAAGANLPIFRGGKRRAGFLTDRPGWISVEGGYDYLA